MLPLDDLIGAQAAGGDGGEVRIVTIDRFVMGLAAFQQLAEQVSGLSAQLKEQKILPVEPVVRV